MTPLLPNVSSHFAPRAAAKAGRWQNRGSFMISYSVDTRPRGQVYFWLAITSVTAAVVVSQVATATAVYSGPITTGTVFTALLFVWDRWVWRWPGLNRFAGIPDLYGTWTGSLTVKTPKGQVSIPVQVRINQRFTSIDLVFESENIRSNARLVGIYTANPENVRITWVYSCAKRHDAVPPKIEDEGITDLHRVEDGEEVRLEGTYYSQNRHTGDFVITRKRAKLWP